MNECIVNHPQVVNSPISNETLLFSDLEKQGKKIRNLNFFLQTSICELYDNLIYEVNNYQLKEANHGTTGKPLISDTYLCVIIPKNLEK